MKKILLSMLFVLLFQGVVYAIEPTLQPSTVNFFPINLQGDTLYLPSQGTFAIGASTLLATAYNNLFELRAEAAATNKGEALFGIGLGLNIPVLFHDIFKANWTYGVINPSLSVMGVMKFGNKTTVMPALGLTIIRIPLK